MSGIRQVITEVVALIEEQAQPLTLAELSISLGVPVDTIRRQVQAFDVEPTAEQVGNVPEIRIEPADLDESARDSPEDLVVIVGEFGRDLLGTERFGAAVLGPLYEAASDLALKEPDNEALASATATLLAKFLPGLSPHSRFRADAIGELARAISARRQVRVRYSRAWEPGVFERVIEPYVLARTPRGVEVDAGPVQADGSIRTYLISRIQHLETLDETFERPADAEQVAADHRTPTLVTGVVPTDRAWAVRRWADDYRELGRDADCVRFEVALLPPVAWRAGLLLLVAGPGAHLDEQRYHDEAVALAGRLWEQHQLGVE